MQAGRLAPSAKLNEAFELLALLFANLERIFDEFLRGFDKFSQNSNSIFLQTKFVIALPSKSLKF